MFSSATFCTAHTNHKHSAICAFALRRWIIRALLKWNPSATRRNTCYWSTLATFENIFLWVTCAMVRSPNMISFLCEMAKNCRRKEWSCMSTKITEFLLRSFFFFFFLSLVFIVRTDYGNSMFSHSFCERWCRATLSFRWWSRCCYLSNSDRFMGNIFSMENRHCVCDDCVCFVPFCVYRRFNFNLSIAYGIHLSDFLFPLPIVGAINEPRNDIFFSLRLVLLSFD